MALDSQVRREIEHLLRQVDVSEQRPARVGRLVEDAARLWRRAQRFLQMGLIATEPDEEALQLACFALQLPLRARNATPGKLGRFSLKDRCEQAAELLAEHLASRIDDSLLDRATRLLHEMSQRPPVLDDARLLADVVNLDDFGVIGMQLLAAELARGGEGISQLAAGAAKREQYGYWDARLRDGFHFEPIRQIARRRLEQARKVAGMLQQELEEDGASGT